MLNDRGALIISLDFELFWGMQDCTTLDEYQDHVLGGRKAIPQLLDLFKNHDIHATWATVGFQFAENFDEVSKYFPDINKRPTYDKKKLSTYRCFDSIGYSEKEAPCFYGASLIKKIMSYKGQEIGSHTFSHYYCREKGQTTEQFREDMKAALSIATDKGISLTSVVLPRNQCTKNHVQVLRELGFLAYRDEENDWIHRRVLIQPLKRVFRLLDVYIPLTGFGGYIPENEDGIVNLLGSRMYKPFFKPLFMLEWLKIHRIKRQMLYAAQNGLFFHLWWHPHNIGVNTIFHLQQLEEILQYYDELKIKYGMRSLNMKEAAEERLSR